MNELRNFMFENVYHNIKVKSAEETSRIETVIETLFRYYSDHPDMIVREYPDLADSTDMEELVKDHIAGMTDRYAENTYKEITK